MSNIKKLEEALELMINEEDEACDKAMHEFCVGLARKINERFEDEELEEVDMEDDLVDDMDSSSDDVEDTMDEIDSEEGVIENDEEEDFGSEEEGDLDSEGDLEDFDDLESDDSEMDSDELDMDMDSDDDFGSDEFSDDEEEEPVEESVELKKVALPSNKEGQEVGSSGKNFTPHTTQAMKPRGELKGTGAKAAMSKGGEASGYPELNKQVKVKAKDMNNPSNVVSSSDKAQKKTAMAGKGDKEVGAGKSVSTNDKSVIGKKVR
jgi:hypothetical protein